MSSDENFTNSEIIFGVLGFLCFFIVIFFFGMKQDDKQTNTYECLEPLAKEICEKRNLNYTSNNEYVVRCKRDVRSTNTEVFNFNMEEKENCQFSFWTGEIK